MINRPDALPTSFGGRKTRCARQMWFPSRRSTVRSRNFTALWLTCGFDLTDYCMHSIYTTLRSEMGEGKIAISIIFVEGAPLGEASLIAYAVNNMAYLYESALRAICCGFPTYPEQ